MALNQIHNPGEQFSVPADAVTTPTGEAEKVSGAPALVGELPVVLLTSPEEDSTGVERVTVKTNGIWEFPVEATDGAIAIGDRVYVDPAPAESMTLSNTEATAYGFALAEVADGDTTPIPVLIHP